MFYRMIWADPCSDTFFQAFEMSMTWIATTCAVEGAAGVALGYIDYKIKTGNPPDLIMALRKKRLAFAKFSFVMAICALMLIDKPSANAVAPMVVGQAYTAFKMGTQMSYNLTPDRFFMPRTFISMYNLVLLLSIWYKLREARYQKVRLEY